MVVLVISLCFFLLFFRERGGDNDLTLHLPRPRTLPPRKKAHVQSRKGNKGILNHILSSTHARIHMDERGGRAEVMAAWGLPRDFGAVPGFISGTKVRDKRQ